MKIKISDNLVCRICSTQHTSSVNRNKCILSHNITLTDYIIQYYLDGIKPKCKCGCETEIKSIKWIKDDIIVSEYTTNHFPRKPHTDDVKEKIKNRTKDAITQKYGVDNVFRLGGFKEKIRQTNLSRYGVDNPMKNDEIKKKSHHYQTDETREKIRRTNQKRYGANSYTASDDGKLAVKRTNVKRFGYTNPMKHIDIRNKVAQTNLDKYGYSTNFLIPDYRKLYNIRRSKWEGIVHSAIGGEKSVVIDGYEFDIRLGNYLIEIDGDYYHTDSMTDLSFIQLNAKINDYVKDQVAKKNGYTLLRIKVSKLKELKVITLDSIIDNSYSKSYKLDYRTTFLSKSYLSAYKDKYGIDKLEQYVPMILKFIRVFNPNFPTITSNETVEFIRDGLTEFDINKMIIGEDYTNSSYNTGVSFLKSNFYSYWESSYKGSKSPIDAWVDDDTMLRIIKNRIGVIGDSYNISISGLIYALTVHRYSVSFFRPTLAKTIYETELGNVDTPTVLDPCAGFGGRLLGFKLRYPNGRYVGVEPNKNTYDSLCNLVSIFGFTNVELYNSKIEDFKPSEKYDLVFTSIPYYNLENYNNEFEYKSFDDWTTEFIKTLITFDNLLLNMDITTFELLTDTFEEYKKIYNTTSPFNTSPNSRYELLVKFKKTHIYTYTLEKL